MNQNLGLRRYSAKDVLKCRLIAPAMQEIVEDILLDLNVGEKQLSRSQLSPFWMKSGLWLDCWLSEEIWFEMRENTVYLGNVLLFCLP